ncbi:MAG: class I SAM-dependent methyltransferase [Candidatus Paceibacterota bacterium]
MNDYVLLSERFSRFKEISREEETIINLIRQNILVNENCKILDIGSNRGAISHALQKNTNNITLIDVEDFDIKTGARFFKGKWEDLNLDEKFDVILASHIWGHFHYEKTTRKSFEKALNSLTPKGKIILCYNSNDDFVGKLVNFCNTIFNDFQYDIFDESLLDNPKIVNFSLTLKCKDFGELADLVQVLIIVPDTEFESKKAEIESFLRNNLEKPEFAINQKLVIIG